jgi:hypothetical protein
MNERAARVFTMGDAPEVNSRQGPMFWMRLGVADLLVVTDCSNSARGRQIGRLEAEEQDGGRLGFATGGGAPAVLRGRATGPSMQFVTAKLEEGTASTGDRRTRLDKRPAAMPCGSGDGAGRNAAQAVGSGS